MDLDFHKQYEEGFPIFEKLFQLKKEQLIKILKIIFQDTSSIIEFVDSNPQVTKTSKNDTPSEIAICYYDKITISPFGIYFKPEHGTSRKILMLNKFFNIDAALAEL